MRWRGRGNGSVQVRTASRWKPRCPTVPGPSSGAARTTCSLRTVRWQGRSTGETAAAGRTGLAECESVATPYPRSAGPLRADITGRYGRSRRPGRSSGQPRRFGVPRALPVRDIPARSLAVSMADQSQGHGNGSRQVARSRSCRWRAEGDPHDRARGDHHGQVADTATLLPTATDEILGTHRYPGRSVPGRCPWRTGPGR